MDFVEKELIRKKYCSNELGELKKICNPIIYKKGIPQMYHDDLYSDAMNVLEESLDSYNENKGSFRTYLTGNIKRSYYDWTRYITRGKRSNVLRDSKGKIQKDEYENNIIIYDISFDAPTEDGIDLAEKIASDFNMEDEILLNESESETNLEEWSKEVKIYLDGLSPLQRKIIHMLSNNYDQVEICEELHISVNHYNNSLKRIRSDEKIKPLRPLIRNRNK